MKKATKKVAAKTIPTDRVGTAIFRLTITLLVSVPLAFSTWVQRIFSAPKFALLLSEASILVPLLIMSLSGAARRNFHISQLLSSKQVLIVCLFLIAIILSTIFGVAPVASLLGSSDNQMGLISHICFFICFIGLIVGIGKSEARLINALWAMILTGFVVATYAFVQFFGRDPILPSEIYTYNSASGPVVRVASTLGHSNFLGNFLLYTTPVSFAMAFVASGRARRIAIVATVLSFLAIIFTGTRGAWIGIAAGAIVFAMLELTGRAGKLFHMPRRVMIIRATIGLIIILALIGVIYSNPASRNIATRAQAFIEDGLTGSGRTLLWRDSIRMVPAFALTGSGPEGFRKAFLAYKSKDLGRLAPDINNESSHNSYLDAAISYGLAGAIAYVALIASTLVLLFSARRRAASRSRRLVSTGLLSAFVAVIAHKFFIFDQIPAGLYFFAFAALALALKNITIAENPAIEKRKPEKGTAKRRAVVMPGHSKRGEATLLFFGWGLALLSVWYSYTIVRSDVAIKRAFLSAYAGNFERLVRQGNLATDGLDPAGDYSFLFARALALCSDRLQANLNSNGLNQTDRANLVEVQKKVIELAISHAEKSLEHTLTPDSTYLLLAYAALRIGDHERLRTYATEAVRWDPNFSNARWLMAESYLARGERDQAVSEARNALDINPGSREARSILWRVDGRDKDGVRPVEQLIAHGLKLTNEGNTEKARVLLKRALRKSGGQCPECHRALALLYEAEGQFDKAINEWESFMRDASDGGNAEQAKQRIETLRQKVMDANAGRANNTDAAK